MTIAIGKIKASYMAPLMKAAIETRISIVAGKVVGALAAQRKFGPLTRMDQRLDPNLTTRAKEYLEFAYEDSGQSRTLEGIVSAASKKYNGFTQEERREVKREGIVFLRRLEKQTEHFERAKKWRERKLSTLRNEYNAQKSRIPETAQNDLLSLYTDKAKAIQEEYEYRAYFYAPFKCLSYGSLKDADIRTFFENSANAVPEVKEEELPWFTYPAMAMPISRGKTTSQAGKFENAGVYGKSRRTDYIIPGGRDALEEAALIITRSNMPHKVNGDIPYASRFFHVAELAQAEISSRPDNKKSDLTDLTEKLSEKLRAEEKNAPDNTIANVNPLDTARAPVSYARQNEKNWILIMFDGDNEFFYSAIRRVRVFYKNMARASSHALWQAQQLFYQASRSKYTTAQYPASIAYSETMGGAFNETGRQAPMGCYAAESLMLMMKTRAFNSWAKTRNLAEMYMNQYYPEKQKEVKKAAITSIYTRQMGARAIAGITGLSILAATPITAVGFGAAAVVGATVALSSIYLNQGEGTKMARHVFMGTLASMGTLAAYAIAAGTSLSFFIPLAVFGSIFVSGGAINALSLKLKSSKNQFLRNHGHTMVNMGILVAGYAAMGQLGLFAALLGTNNGLMFRFLNMKFDYDNREEFVENHDWLPRFAKEWLLERREVLRIDRQDEEMAKRKDVEDFGFGTKLFMFSFVCAFDSVIAGPSPFVYSLASEIAQKSGRWFSGMVQELMNTLRAFNFDPSAIPPIDWVRHMDHSLGQFISPKLVLNLNLHSFIFLGLAAFGFVNPAFLWMFPVISLVNYAAFMYTFRAGMKEKGGLSFWNDVTKLFLVSGLLGPATFVQNIMRLSTGTAPPFELSSSPDVQVAEKLGPDGRIANVWSFVIPFSRKTIVDNKTYRYTLPKSVIDSFNSVLPEGYRIPEKKFRYETNAAMEAIYFNKRTGWLMTVSGVLLIAKALPGLVFGAPLSLPLFVLAWWIGLPACMSYRSVFLAGDGNRPYDSYKKDRDELLDKETKLLDIEKAQKFQKKSRRKEIKKINAKIKGKF
ncbi:hypothetical protein A3J90_04490 [candidate division WOR-1 bacterium RIFOXYC2_FULL_37_10]|nr:MAG: hypothetical protein A2246_03590 [candidate division WOR-1 bacterium RIFOXYA2_FULL_37_7]OGC33617.1 MAG: hypothetical protein A3J90_04490 [candidate division WOR-1 bacterium RIFOXYC2_FULL_37_10]